MFSLNLEKNFFVIQNFVENEKHENHIMQRLVNIADGVEKIPPEFNFFSVWFLLNVTLQGVLMVLLCKAF